MMDCIKNTKDQLIIPFSKIQTLVKLSKCLNEPRTLKPCCFQGVSIKYMNNFCGMFYAPLMINSQHRHPG